ncbi:hypothetical protein B0H67DRAFT_170619 [Lasiosphaeris hirsuta]|uniref:Uncharacterized protein n=1 Tax=Lasiosphaeris hirsuta TaxID=260670 RepID=A0AA40AQ59_9PEZI|nr:hypothetical protein B0H67DRAFT_170619 [Lasiosphaeris hirsuta]
MNSEAAARGDWRTWETIGRQAVLLCLFVISDCSFWMCNCSTCSYNSLRKPATNNQHTQHPRPHQTPREHGYGLESSGTDGEQWRLAGMNRTF